MTGINRRTFACIKAMEQHRFSGLGRRVDEVEVVRVDVQKP
jgi:hypothetical protein